MGTADSSPVVERFRWQYPSEIAPNETDVARGDYFDSLGVCLPSVLYSYSFFCPAGREVILAKKPSTVYNACRICYP